PAADASAASSVRLASFLSLRFFFDFSSGGVSSSAAFGFFSATARFSAFSVFCSSFFGCAPNPGGASSSRSRLGFLGASSSGGGGASTLAFLTSFFFGGGGGAASSSTGGSGLVSAL